MHQASSVVLLQKRDVQEVTPEFYAEISAWQEISEVLPPALSLNYAESLRRRRSQRNFIEKEIELESLHLLLGTMVQGAGDLYLSGLEIVFLASGVCGLADGLYLFDRVAERFALFVERDMRSAVAAAALDQGWLKQAALQFLFYADLEAAQEGSGSRSYRYLQIGAGRLGQRLYLGATALGLGCCAVGAFYDRELAQVYRLPENFDPLYLVAVGPVAGPK
jgi:SagB-type dehydrogenase family enzyme